MENCKEREIPKPKEELSFSSLALRKELITNLSSLDYSKMTPIQAQSLPLMLNHADVIAQAQTGSGKTVAFGLTLLNFLKVDQLQPQALVLCPTRELAEQVSQVLRRLARLLPNVKILNLSGGIPMRPQVESLKYGAHLIIGTPGRIQKHLAKGTLSLACLGRLVLDEADKMLEMGFLDAIKHVLSYCPAKRQTLLFSATFPTLIKELATEFMSKPFTVKIEEGQGNIQAIEQSFFEVPNQADKYALLKKLLGHYQPTSTLIFCNTKESTQELAKKLNQDGLSATVLNGDLEQSARDEAMIQFSNQSCSILVATDVAARGLDIKELPAVINYELAFAPETHIHRVGRTGRAGCKGIALNLTTPKDAERLCALEQLMSQPLQWGLIKDLQSPKPLLTLQPKMLTLRLMAGKRDKIRPGDILGALTKDAGLHANLIGKIDILATHSYVAIEQSQIGKAYAQFNKGKLKGKKVGVQQL
ncbi:ATP-dependent RNA helicase DbpA [Legionella sp. km772]|uniref:ATP-dependent RNA helicase DbpA n=1 Tax=Legionella sp. km772 TaxID=2498111 RepID=UPI000F8EA722|nr:ATP-dependent RNA helicase DbpA [Legionella sp. km772]RUR08775.1 ATP-dependent RNA helicase DbpA [Legionella sp. km772]